MLTPQSVLRACGIRLHTNAVGVRLVAGIGIRRNSWRQPNACRLHHSSAAIRAFYYLGPAWIVVDTPAIRLSGEEIEWGAGYALRERRW